MSEFYAILQVIQVLSVVYILYRGTLGLAGLRAPKPARTGKSETKFLVLVPAHNEEAVISDTSACILGLDYPSSRRNVFVIADDCSDATAANARRVGAGVLTKAGPSTGKGAAMSWALNQQAIKSIDWDAVVFFDADSRPVSNFLQLMDGALGHGDRVIQGRRESHGQRGWIPTAYAVNTALRNRLWHQARESVGFSAALTGTGICIERSVLAQVPLVTHTLTEDLEYGVQLEMAGINVRYLHEAATIIDQPPSLEASTGQRLRWARGQVLTSLTYGPRLVWRGIKQRRFASIDYFLYLLLPSLVPLQAFLLLSLGAAVLAGREPFMGGAWGPDEGLFLLSFVAIAFSFFLTYVGLNVERQEYVLRDWAAFVLLMLTWLPIALYGALTSWASNWVTTPRSSEPYDGAIPGHLLKTGTSDPAPREIKGRT